jgi:signal transduction histidine kinase
VTVLAVCSAVGALVEDLISPTATLPSGTYDRGPEAVLVATLGAAVAVLALRGRLGLAAPLAALACFALASLPAPAWVLDSSFVYLIVMLSCGLGGYTARSWQHVIGLGVVAACGSVAALRHPDPSLAQGASVVAFMAIAWAAGALVRLPVSRAASAEERATQLELEQALAAQQAVADERRRIARELHDIIAHSVSVMTLQAGAVRRRLTPDQVREHDSLLAVEETGREALAEMRHLVGLLKEEDAVPSLAPQPGMGALGSLVSSVRAAGLPVDLRVEGAARRLPPGVDLAAYRVVQEALTNTLKYGGTAEAHVRIQWASDELRIEVANDGRNTSNGTGFGQEGMRERLRLYGGRLESGPRPEGGYLVRARLPVGAEA